MLAAAEPLASTYRSVNSYPHLAAATIEGNAEAMTEAQLGNRARVVLDGIYRDELTAWRTLFETRQGRASTDTAQAARAATVGAVDSIPFSAGSLRTALSFLPSIQRQPTTTWPTRLRLGQLQPAAVSSGFERPRSPKPRR